ncbi:MAG: hypothetical protein AUG51_12435 [Acidobacteria bacterium 13_1_20CM_3_53_8]|nr:MAG: hypothetical protein AUG51_12435 [Acidobacteria bacterium 13_1_20CM_3_53_8]
MYSESKESPRNDVILIVNDVPDQLNLMAVLLRKTGYNVLMAEDGREGFKIAKREHPDLIISDVAMPNVNGFELCHIVREDKELGDTPLLLVSAFHLSTESAVKGLQAGADDYLEAPYEPVRLIAKVSRLLERGRLEAALKESEERYRDLVENAQDIIYTHDLEGRYTSLNKAGQRITGYTLEEALTMGISQTVAPEYIEKARQMIGRKLAGEEQSAYELEIITKDGRRVAVEVNTRLIYENGVAVGVQGIARDVMERKNLEEQLQRSQKLEAVGRLAGGIAHDFNNLLTAIMGYSDLALRRLGADDPLRANLEEIRKAGLRATSLTSQLLAFSRKQVLQPKVLNLNSIISETEKMLKRLIGEDVELRAVLDPSLGQVKADPGQMVQVIMNLVVNARDAMPEGGKLTIETKNVYLDKKYASQHVAVEPGHYVMIAVSDTGHGMIPETQAHIFEPFFTTKEMGKGTGLGLSTVYGIVKQSGGNIWVYSEAYKGTTFKVYLPRVDEQVETERFLLEKSESHRGSETILLVEDEELVRGLVYDTLELEGYKVLVANNGKEALRIGEEYRSEIHLVITDVVMPEMGGRALAEGIARLRTGIKVLYMSGYTDDAIVHHGVLDKGVNFIQKPFAPDALVKRVREALDKSL